MKKIKFIYNPISGTKEIKNKLDIIIEKYQNEGYVIIPFRIDFKQDLENALIDIDSSYHHILIAGGDGTINRVINILKNRNLDIPIAILPVGTANDFAKHIGMPSEIELCVDKILSGEIHEIDLGLANEKYFINVFSFGLFSDTSQKTPTHLKNTIGKLAYFFNGIKELPTFKKIDIEVATPTFTYSGNCIIFFIFNGRTAGNINICYKSEINDGVLDMLIIKGENIRTTLLSVFEFLKGAHLENPKDIIHIKSNNFKIKFNNPLIKTDIDGEVGPNSPIEIKCIEKGLKIIY